MTTAERRAWAEMERRAERMEPALRLAILDAFRRLASRLDFAAIERAIRAGDLDAVIQATLSDAAINRAFYPARRTLRDGVASAASATIRNTPRLREIGVVFDQLSPQVLEAVRTIESGSLGFLQGEMRDGLRAAVETGLQAGRNPRAIARELQNSLGLTRYQEGIVQNFRTALESGDAAKALGYTLRDKRFDAQLRRLARTETPLTGDQVDRMVAGYTRRYRAYNAEVHARTAALEAQRVGNQTAWQESAAELGDGFVVLKRWNATMDTRTRPEHAAMNGAEALLDGAYSNGDTYPGQSSPWNCRCVETYRVARADQLQTR